mmetsp:Transcript_13044/g.15035  ORF Transcript_13044/g.15035 Transcript_13044/m.15035 type:complete len:236 (+) Transcript_13044:191-898(+)
MLAGYDQNVSTWNPQNMWPICNLNSQAQALNAENSCPIQSENPVKESITEFRYFNKDPPVQSSESLQELNAGQNQMEGTRTVLHRTKVEQTSKLSDEVKSEDVPTTNSYLDLPGPDFKYEVLKIENMQAHLSIPFENLDTEFRKSFKGRKRNKFLKSQHMHEFLVNIVTPTWSKMLGESSTREREIGVLQKGNKFVWLQFFKDVRKFYRLIFKLRFHRSDKRSDENRAGLVQKLL